MTLDDDLRQAITERLKAQAAAAQARAEHRRRQLAELRARRQRGLAARHRARLQRAQETEPSSD